MSTSNPSKPIMSVEILPQFPKSAENVSSLQRCALCKTILTTDNISYGFGLVVQKELRGTFDKPEMYIGEKPVCVNCREKADESNKQANVFIGYDYIFSWL